nr:reverse transcriptase domain-containing protein [Tanacetum cinerariifolium]
ESDEFIKSSVEDLVLILSKFEDTPESDSGCVLPSCDDFSPINIFEEKSMTFSNPLYDSNENFTSSDDKSLFDEDVSKYNVKIYSNPLFKFDDEYIFSDVNLLFNEVLEDIECMDSYDSNLDESTFLVIPLSDSKKDEYFATDDDVELLLHRDPSSLNMSVISILEGFTDEPPLKENDDLFDLESKENKWKKILYDAPIDDLTTEDKTFDLGIPEKFFSPTYVSLPFTDRPYFFFTYVVRILLLYFTYPVVSPCSVLDLDLVEEVEELERKRAELVEELPIKVAEEGAEEDDRNANLGNGRNGCSYKEFVACKPKEFDGKGGVVAYIR